MYAIMKCSTVVVLLGLVDVNAVSLDFTKKMARARLEKSNLPDPVCRTGIISLPILPGKKHACCPHYCKECNDYKTCEKVRGQDSKNACCASEVLKMQCGTGAAANVCLKKCSESLPPCIMDDDEVRKLAPPKTNAADDCNEVIKDWRLQVAAAMETPPTTPPPTTTTVKTTTASTTTSDKCTCFHCGGTQEFPSADICGAASDSCGPNAAGNGCWTNVNAACVCSTQTIVKPCQCYHCGGNQPFPSADICGAANDSCGPDAAGDGCWTNVNGNCQCDTESTTG